MQDNLTSKKMVYLSLALLLSCAVSSAYGMQGIKNYLSGWGNYFTGVRNGNQDNNLDSEDGEEIPLNDNNRKVRLSPEEQEELLVRLTRKYNGRVNACTAEEVLADVPSLFVEPQNNEVHLYNNAERRGARERNTQAAEDALAGMPSLFDNLERGLERREERERNEQAAEEALADTPSLFVEPSEEQPAPRLNALASALNKARNNKGRIAAGVGVVAVGATAYAYREPIARHLKQAYQKAKLNAQAAWQKLRNEKITKGVALKGALGLAGTATTAYAARKVYQNPEAARNVLSNRKAQLGALGALATIAGTKLAYNYLTKSASEQPDAQAADARALMIEEFIATFTEEQWSCPGVIRVVEALAQGNAALGTTILVDSGVKLSDTQVQKLQDILDTIPS